jgi:hypothetical protein
MDQIRFIHIILGFQTTGQFRYSRLTDITHLLNANQFPFLIGAARAVPLLDRRSIARRLSRNVRTFVSAQDSEGVRPVQARHKIPDLTRPSPVWPLNNRDTVLGGRGPSFYVQLQAAVFRSDFIPARYCRELEFLVIAPPAGPLLQLNTTTS